GQAMSGCICPRGEKSVKVAEIFLPGYFMNKRLSFSGLMQLLWGVLGDLPEPRKGTNKTYMIQDAAMGAFAVFFMQSASFLANQKAMQTREGRNNASSMFGLKHIPSDNQIRNLLDLLEAKLLFPVFAKVVSALEESGELEAFRSHLPPLSDVSPGTGHRLAKSQTEMPKFQIRIA